MSFYKMERGWQKSEVFSGEKYSERDAWVWLIETATWKQGAKPVSIKGKPLKLKRGELSHSIRFMAQKFKWDKGKVERFLKKLSKWGMIKILSKTKTGQNIVTICNYSKYQDRQDSERDRGETGARQGRDKEEEGTKKEEEGIKNIEEDILFNNLSVEDVSTWLEKKRVSGKYLTIDEHSLLDKFKNYCTANNRVTGKKKYSDFVRAFQNSFEWENPPIKNIANNGLEKMKEMMNV